MSGADKLVQRLVNLFGAPECPDPAGYVEEIRDSCQGYADDILAEVGNRLRDTCHYFPRPALIHEHIAAVIASRNIGKPKNLLPQEPELPPVSPEEAERARKLVEEASAIMLKRGREAMGIKDEPPPDVSREAFEAARKASPNLHLHAKLSVRSRQMMGGRDEHAD